MVEIKSTCCGVVICSGETVRLAVESAVAAGVSLENADLRDADLEGVDLRGANLRGAYLHWANLINANLDGTILRNATLRGTHFVEGSTYNNLTHVSYAGIRDLGAIL